MTIWSSEIKELEKLYECFRGQLPDLDKELGRLIKAEDENMILLYSRRCLEVIITDLCESELKRPRKTEPLQGIIDKLNKEEKVPSHIIASMQSLNTLSTFGTHPKDFDPEQIKPVLINLDIIIKWYLKFKKVGAEIDVSSSVGDEAGIKNTEDFIKSIRLQKKRLAGLILGSFVLFAVVVGILFLTGIIGSNRKIKELEKSIAVLPFINDSPDQERMYFINGTMEAILDNLCKIKDLRVRGRTSVEQYRNNLKPIPTIAKELDVSYILEGSGHRDGNNVRLYVQLLDGMKDQHLWHKTYNEDIEQIFSMQSEIAKLVAEEIEAIITPEEKKLIEKVPTANLTAYDFYQRGKQEYLKFWLDKDNNEALKSAEYLYNRALSIDSTFALAYASLAALFWDKDYLQDYLSESFMDSVPILCDIALNFDPQLSEAHTLKGTYYSETGNPELAVEEFDKAIGFNANDWMAYRGKGDFYYETDWVNYIKNYQKALSINRGPEITDLLSKLGYAYASAGFFEKAEQYHQDKLKLDSDSANYYSELARYEFWKGNFNKSNEFAIKSYAIDSTDVLTLVFLGDSFEWLGRHEESLEYFEKYIERTKTQNSEWEIINMHRVAYSYWQNGYKKEAEYYFNEKINQCKRMIILGRLRMLYPYYDLAGVYAFRGEKDKAYENLRIFNKRPIMSSWMVSLMKTDPLFNSIRNEPKFQQIVKEVESKYQAEHERVKKWLEEQGML